jgi:hypothetical protein
MFRMFSILAGAAVALSAQVAHADSFIALSPPVALPTSEELAAGLTSTCPQTAEVSVVFTDGATGANLKSSLVQVAAGKSVILTFRSPTYLKMVYGSVSYMCPVASLSKTPVMLVSRNRKTKVVSFSYF